jgi:MinD superfamily P-loop ATPase
VKELLVISGKGGTGKTSVTASFAALAQDAVLVDCDVDAADLHLILDPAESRPRVFIGGKVAAIDRDACTGCGLCAEACRFEAVVPVGSSMNGGERYTVDPMACEGCGVCALVCPVGAASLNEEASGEWTVSETRFGPLVHARLLPARGNSGKLVTLVRGAARTIADDRNASLILADGPPGIGCPVIASLSGADAVLIVTEPSLSGLHDLERVTELARNFRTTPTVCINKWDLAPDVTETLVSWCRSEDVPVVGRIPYDRAVTDAQVQGVSVIEHGEGPAATAIRDVWKQVGAALGIETEVRR